MTLLSAKSNLHEPPGISELPAVVEPTWAKIRAYIDAGRLGHVDIHKDPVATRDKGGRAGKRARRDGDAVQQPCFGWSSQRGCHLLKKGEPCRFSHEPANMFRGNKQGNGSASGAANEAARAGGSAASAASTSGDGGGSSRGGASFKQPC